MAKNQGPRQGPGVKQLSRTRILLDKMRRGEALSVPIVMELFGLSRPVAQIVLRQAYTELRAASIEEAEIVRNVEMSRLDDLYHRTILQLEGLPTDENGNPSNTAHFATLINSLAKISDQRSKITGLYTMKFDMAPREAPQVNFDPMDQARLLALLESQGVLQAPPAAALLPAHDTTISEGEYLVSDDQSESAEGPTSANSASQ